MKFFSLILEKEKQMTDLTLVRNNIQVLLAKIEDEIVLQQFYHALLWFSKAEEGQLWNALSTSQQNRLLAKVN